MHSTATPTSANTAVHILAAPRALSSSMAKLDDQRKGDILPGDTHRSPADTHNQGHPAQIVVHDDHVGGLDGRVGAQRAHGDATSLRVSTGASLIPSPI
jgi:hypothetical protein